MEFTLKVIEKEKQTIIKGDEYISLLTLLQQNEIYLSAPCNGKGRCGKCNVKATGMFSNTLTGEKIKVKDKLISACHYAPVFDCEIILPNNEINTYLLDLPFISSKQDSNLGLAVDIGTTSIEAALYDLKTGSCISKVHQANKQATFGADVISRIESAKNGKLYELCSILKQQIQDIAVLACQGAHNNPNLIEQVVIAGNTIMEYFAARIDPYELAVPPFHAEFLFGANNPYCEFPLFAKNVKVYFTDCLSAYIGGDVLAGCLYNKFEQNDKLTLFIDLGTNGELVLGKKDKYVSCSSAAGPAFEAETMSCGMQATVGAINKVQVVNSMIQCEIISSTQAKGICGSGMIDSIACLLEKNYIGKTGLIKNTSYFAKDSNEARIHLKDGVYVSQSDIRNVLLAKGAIAAGIEILTQEYGCKIDEIEEIILAGNFGSYVNPDSCVKIGLLPYLPMAKIKAVGNSSLAGACMLLDENNQNVIKQIKSSMSYIDLSTDERFTDIFSKNLRFK